LGRAGLGAGRRLADLLTVVAERALAGHAAVVLDRGLVCVASRFAQVRDRELALVVDRIDQIDHAERARDDAVAAAVADVRLHVDIAELVLHDRAGRTGLLAAGVRAVLAHVAHHQPLLDDRARRGRFDRDLLDECDVPPGRARELRGVVVRVAREREAVRRQLVPLLARYLAGLAPDAERGVGEEAGLAHAVLLGARGPRRIAQVSDFDSWIETFGSITNGITAPAESPRANPSVP